MLGTTMNKTLTFPLAERQQPKEIAGWAKDGERHELVHVWRVGKDAAWVELIIEGPPGSFYEGAC
jgi:hypothetical protein